MPKAVYRSGCRCKYIRVQHDSNLGPLTPQSDMQHATSDAVHSDEA